MNRRKFLTSAAASVAATSLSSSAQAHPRRGPDPSKPPNIVFMICDDLGHGDLACYGSDLSTPNIDRMAAEGLRCAHHDSAHPLCSASRAAVLTGRYAPRSNVPNVYFPQDTGGMDLDESTIANVLKARNYRTMAIGKWHLGHTPKYLPTNRGFDGYFGVPYSVDMHPLPLIENTKVIEPHTDRNLLTPRYTKKALEFIESGGDKPFFLYLAFSYPHIPIHASARFRGKSRHGIYGDTVMEIDWSVGEIMRAVKRQHQDDNTLFIFTSDHGPWFQGSPGELRERKGSTYEGGVRVPMVARWQGVIPEGRVLEEWTSHLDFLPTFASLSGAPLPSKPLDGMNASSLLTGRQEKLDRGVILYFQGWDLQCARWGDWKLHIARYNTPWFYPAPPGGRHTIRLATPELYNIAEDPMECYDVASRNPRIVAKILAEVEGQLGSFTEKLHRAYQEIESRPGVPGRTPDAPARQAS